MIKANLVNSSVVFAYNSDSVESVVQSMIDNKVSSVLILDSKDQMMGIITERDIVRKFTLLAVNDKLERLANTIMTRPIHFVSLDNMFEEMSRLHATTKIRHFPIVLEPGLMSKDNLVGIVTPTDLFRQQLDRELESGKVFGGNVLVLSASEDGQRTYQTLFNKLGYEVERGKLTDTILIAKDNRRALVVDLDGSSVVEIEECLQKVWKHKGQVFLLTSDVNLIKPFRKKMDSMRQHIALKPLDVSYINWLIGKATSS